MMWKNNDNCPQMAMLSVAKNRHHPARFTVYLRALLPPRLFARIGPGGAGRWFSNLVEMPASCVRCMPASCVRCMQCEISVPATSHCQTWNAAPVAHNEVHFQGRPRQPIVCRFHEVYRARQVSVHGHPAGALQTKRTACDVCGGSRWNRMEVLRQFNLQAARQNSPPLGQF